MVKVRVGHDTHDDFLEPAQIGGEAERGAVPHPGEEACVYGTFLQFQDKRHPSGLSRVRWNQPIQVGGHLDQLILVIDLRSHVIEPEKFLPQGLGLDIVHIVVIPSRGNPIHSSPKPGADAQKRSRRPGNNSFALYPPILRACSFNWARTGTLSAIPADAFPILSIPFFILDEIFIPSLFFLQSLGRSPCEIESQPPENGSVAGLKDCAGALRRIDTRVTVVTNRCSCSFVRLPPSGSCDQLQPRTRSGSYHIHGCQALTRVLPLLNCPRNICVSLVIRI